MMLKRDVIGYFYDKSENPKKRSPTAETAKALGVHYQTVYNWGQHIPDSLTYKMESISGGKLKR